jgi:cytochrome c oxidase subunit 2
MLTAFARWPLNYLTSDGPRADPVTGLTWGLIVLSVAVVTIITVAVATGVWVRRDRNKVADLAAVRVLRPPGDGMTWIYVGMPLTVIALAVFLVWTMRVLAAVDAPPRPPRVTLEVTGRQWWWQLRYLDPSGKPLFATANEIHVPVGEPVLIKLLGGDVIHSFWVPALTGKTDTIPGRQNLSWIQANHAGVYRGQCTEYCGLQHAHMAVFVMAEAPAAYAAWRAGQMAPAAASSLPGEAVFVAKCGGCHTVVGTRAHGLKGPDLTHLMSRRTIAAGVLENTVDNLSGWISDPQAQKPGTLMKTTYLSGPQLHDVVGYLETLK